MKRILLLSILLLLPGSVCIYAQSYIIPSSGAPIEAYNLHEEGNYIFYQEKGSAPDQFKMIEKSKVDFIKRETDSNKTESGRAFEQEEQKPVNTSSTVPLSFYERRFNVLDKGKKAYVALLPDVETPYEKALVDGVKKGIKESGYWNLVDSPEEANIIIGCSVDVSGKDEAHILVFSSYQAEFLSDNSPSDKYAYLGIILTFSIRSNEDPYNNTKIGVDFVSNLIGYIEEHKKDPKHFLNTGSKHERTTIYCYLPESLGEPFAHEDWRGKANQDSYYYSSKIGQFCWWCYDVCRELPDNFSFSVSGTVDSQPYVDMGTGIKWATCNIGAKSPDELGEVYTWGGTRPRDRSDLKYMETVNGKECYIKYTKDDGKTVLEREDDTASCLLGESWRMPTVKELEKLLANCEVEFAKYHGSCGTILTSKSNGNTMFIPMFFNSESKRDFTGLWSSEYQGKLNPKNEGLATLFFFNAKSFWKENDSRSYLEHVRAVSDAK